MCLPRCIAAAGLSLMLVATSAAAQRGREELTEAKRTRPIWRVGFDGGSAHENDVRFLGDGADDTFHRAGGALTGGVVRGRARVELDARGEVVRFVSLRDLDRETYDVGVTLGGSVSSRTVAQVALRALTSTTPSGLPQFDAALLPLVISRSRAAVASVVTRQTPTFETTMAVDATDVRFDDPAFAGGHTIGATGLLALRPSAGSRRSLNADVRLARFDTLEIGTLTLDAGVSHQLRRWTVELSGGATVLQSRGSATTVRPTGALEVSRPSPVIAVTATMSRRMEAAIGFGQAFLSDIAAVRLEHARPRGFAVSLTMDGSRNIDPLSPELSLQFASLTGEVRRPIVSGLTLALAGYARRRVQGQTFSNSGVSLAARFDTPR